MRVLTITTPDVENGLGNRVTIWFAGCSHRCIGCHNHHTWDYNQGTPLFDEGVIEKIFSEVDKDYIAGITLAGGDPFSQNDESLNELLKFVNDHGIRDTGIFVELCAMPDKMPFYEKLGFDTNEAQRLKMMYLVR